MRSYGKEVGGETQWLAVNNCVNSFCQIDLSVFFCKMCTFSLKLESFTANYILSVLTGANELDDFQHVLKEQTQQSKISNPV